MNWIEMIVSCLAGSVVFLIGHKAGHNSAVRQFKMAANKYLNDLKNGIEKVK